MARPICNLAFSIVVALTSTAWISGASAAEFRKAVEPVDSQYIVVLKPEFARLAEERTPFTEPVASLASGLVATYGGKVLFTYSHALRGFAVHASSLEIAAMLKDPRIAYIQQDGRVHASTTQASPANWGLDWISTRTPPSTGYTYTTTASNVHAYVIDTGINTSNTDFAGRIGAGYGAVADGNGINDCDGHGTHVSGILGGKVYGVAKGVILHPVRVLDCNGAGTSSGIVAGVDWVQANHVSPAVANMSLGGSIDTSIDAAVKSLVASGVTVAVAAGNQSLNACQYSPSDVSTAIAVGSMRNTDSARSSFSNYGSCVAMFAPGSAIPSDYIGGTTATAVLSGTSMASPFVAGAAALYLATHATATPAQVKAYLLSTATPSLVLAPGGTNLLAYTLTGTATPLPAVAAPPGPSLNCSSLDNNKFMCAVGYTSLPTTPTAVLWPSNDADIKTTMSGQCVLGGGGTGGGPSSSIPVTVEVFVGNRTQTDSLAQTFTCQLGGITP